MNINKTAAALLTMAGLTATLTWAGAGAAHASGSDAVIRTGACSGTAHWKLKVSPDDGRLQVEAEVDSNQAGQDWQWVMRHNDSLTAQGVATTTAPSGSFEVRRRVVDLSGTDQIVFRATHAGQVCRGVVNY